MNVAFSLLGLMLISSGTFTLLKLILEGRAEVTLTSKTGQIKTRIYEHLTNDKINEFVFSKHSRRISKNVDAVKNQIQSIIIRGPNEDYDESGSKNVTKVDPKDEDDVSCSRVPKYPKEFLIGPSFDSLCNYFGPRIRDEILEVIDFEAVVSTGRGIGEVYEDAFERKKSSLVKCLEDIRETSRSINSSGCMKDLIFVSDPSLQPVWLLTFPVTLNLVNSVIEGYQKTKVLNELVDKLIEDGTLKKFDLPKFYWARIMMDRWKESKVRDKHERLKDILKDRPFLQEVCNLSSSFHELIQDREKDPCLSTILGNLLILEDALENDGQTLEREFVRNMNTFQYLLSVVKTVLKSRRKEEKENLLKRDKKFERVISKVHELRNINVRCLNDLREKFDVEGGNFSNFYDSIDVKRCTNNVLETIESLLNGKGSVDDLLKLEEAAERVLIKSVLETYEKLKFVKPIVRKQIDDIASKKLGFVKIAWAQEFVRKWRNSNVKDKNERLEDIFHSTDVNAILYHCALIVDPEKLNNECWRSFVTGLIIIESEILKSGVTLQTVFIGNPLLMNLVFVVDKALLEANANSRRAVKKYSREGHSQSDFKVDETVSNIVDDKSNNDLARKLADVLRSSSVVSKLSDEEWMVITDAEEPTFRLFPFSFGGFGGQYDGQKANTFTDTLKDPFVQSLVKQTTGVSIETDPAPKTLVGGFAGRVADLLSYPILGHSVSKVVKGGVQGATDSVIGSVKNMIFG